MCVTMIIINFLMRFIGWHGYSEVRKHTRCAPIRIRMEDNGSGKVLGGKDGTEESLQMQEGPQDAPEPHADEQGAASEASPQTQGVTQDVLEPQVEEQEAASEASPQTQGVTQDVLEPQVEEQEADPEASPETQGVPQDAPEPLVEEQEAVSEETQGAPQDAPEPLVEEQEADPEASPKADGAPQDVSEPQIEKQESVQLPVTVITQSPGQGGGGTTTQVDVECMIDVEGAAEAKKDGGSGDVEVSFNVQVEVPLAPATQEVGGADGAPTEAEAAGPQTRQVEIECKAVISPSPTGSPDAITAADSTTQVLLELKVISGSELEVPEGVATATMVLADEKAEDVPKTVSEVRTKDQVEDIPTDTTQPPEIKIESQEDATEPVRDDDKPPGGDLLHADDVFDLLKSSLEFAGPSDAIAAQDQCFHHPLSLDWCYGYNLELPVHNISEENRKMVFYVCAHTGVLYDCANNKQCLLQGHSNPISCSAVSNDRRWLATADSGKNCVLIVWDSFTGIPVRTIFDGVGEGTAVVAMSPDSQFLATISASKLQVLSIWEWTESSNKPLCQAVLGEDFSYQTHLTFHGQDSHQLVSNSDDLVVFYNWKGSEMHFHAHPVLDKDFNKTIGKFRQSVFVPGSSLALTGTSEGYSIVWENEEGDGKPHVKKGVKLMRMHDSPITVMTSTMDMVVTGDTEGKVKFFDSELKMVNWYEDTMKFGPLCSISFSYSPSISMLNAKQAAGRSITEDLEAIGGGSYPPESTKAASPFVVPDFTISTTSASIIYFTSNGSIAEVVLSEHDASVNALATHPFLPRLVTSGYACKMKLWDYDKRLVMAVREFGEPRFIQCVSFDPKGEFLSVGFTNGTLQVLDPITLADIGPSFRCSRDAVTKIAFSHDSAFMATADLDKCVSVYVAKPEDTQKPWQFLAKHRSHFKKIKDVMFGIKLDSDAPRLLSLGADRVLVEYDLASSSHDKLQLMSTDRIEQSAIPMAMAWYPPLTTESFLLVTNNQYKIKLHNSTTKMCRQTLLGPTFGAPLKKVIVLPAPIVKDGTDQEVRRYMAYCTKNKVGLLLLPHDGNPHNSKCLIAHPGKKFLGVECRCHGGYVDCPHPIKSVLPRFYPMWLSQTRPSMRIQRSEGLGSRLCEQSLRSPDNLLQVADMKCSFDGKYIFTAGGDDCSVNMWSVHTDALEAVSLLGGEDLQPFYAMLEGGRDGEFFAELEEYFYYAQIRSQGPDVTVTRNVSTKIRIEEIPYVMRALGFYPSELEIEDMMNEVKFSKFVETGSYVTEIDLGNFIRLYINHRPVFGLSPLHIGHAFKVLGDMEHGDDYWSVDRNHLLSLIQAKGEHLTEAEVIECMMTLLGCSENPEVDGAYSTDVLSALEEIPENLTAPLFAEEIIGLSTQ